MNIQLTLIIYRNATQVVCQPKSYEQISLLVLQLMSLSPRWCTSNIESLANIIINILSYILSFNHEFEISCVIIFYHFFSVLSNNTSLDNNVFTKYLEAVKFMINFDSIF